MKFIQDLDHTTRKDLLVVGGKASALGEMLRKGIFVPAGFVVLSSAFEKVLKQNNLHAEIKEILDSINYDNVGFVERSSRKIQARIYRAKIPFNVADEIRKAFHALGAQCVAVRSSAIAEDSAKAAGAGQMETYLNTAEKDLLQNIRKVWASAFTVHALLYRFERKLSKRKISIAVVVQKMVLSEKSGIAFSVHPVSHDANHIVIEAGYGLGEAIVSGQITPDRYIVEKQSQKIIEKDTRTKKRVLSDSQTRELAMIVLKIEHLFGFPCDIEWAIEKKRFYILQSRPITTLEGKTAEEKAPQWNAWIDLGRRETSLLEASIKIAAWSKVLKKLTGRGYKNYSIDSDGNYQTTEKDEHEVLKAAEKMPREKNFEEKTTMIEKDILKELAKHAGSNVLLDLLVLQFGHFLFDRMQADLLFEDPRTPTKTKKRIIAWRNDPLLFASHDRAIAAIAQQCSLTREDARFYSADELRLLLSDKPLNTKALIRERKKGWLCSLRAGKMIVMAQKTARAADLPKSTSGEIQGEVAFGNETIRGVVGKDILVVPMTEPRDISKIKRYKAVITDQGGILSHAAITCRELHIPCIIGTQVGTKVLKRGDIVEVDASTGVIRVIRRTKKKL